MASSLIAKHNARRKVGPERYATISWMGWVRIVLRLICLAMALVLCVPLHLAYRKIHYGSPFPRLFLILAARAVGARVRAHGVPLRRDVFYISIIWAGSISSHLAAPAARPSYQPQRLAKLQSWAGLRG